MSFVEAFTGGNDNGTSAAATTPDLVMAGGGAESVGDIPLVFTCQNSGVDTVSSSSPSMGVQSGPDALGSLTGYILAETAGLSSGDITAGVLNVTWSGGARNLSCGVLLGGRAASGYQVGTPFTNTTAGQTVTVPTIGSVAGGSDVVGCIIVRATGAAADVATQADLTGAGYTIGRAVKTNYGATNQFSMITFYKTNVSAGSYGGETINLSGGTPSHKIAYLIAVPAASGSVAASATLAGAGSLVPTADNTVLPSATMVGAGSLIPTAGNTVFPAVTMQGVGTLIPTASNTVLPTVSMVGAGSLFPSAGSVLTATVTLSGVGTLNPSGTLIRPATTTLIGAGSLNPTGLITRLGAATMQGAGSLIVSPSVTVFPSTLLAGAGSLFPVGTVVSTSTVYFYVPEWLVTDALLALLRQKVPVNVKVYDHFAPRTGRVFPYIVLYRIPGGEWMGPPLTDPQADIVIQYQIDAVGRRRDQVEALGTFIGQVVAGYVNGYLANQLNLPLGLHEYGRLKSDVPAGIVVEGVPPHEVFTYPGRYQVAVTAS